MQTQTLQFEAIKRPSVVQDIIAIFKQKLIQGELKPGQRLPSEYELAQQMNVGRSAVREAMKILEGLGVIIIQQGSGTYISESPSANLLNPLVFAILLQTNPASDLIELRDLIQVGYCQLAARHSTLQDWQNIERAERDYETYAEQSQRDAGLHAQLDLAFHYAIIEAAHNPLVIMVSRAVEELFFASIRSTLTREKGLEWGISSHRKLVEAISKQEPETIRQVVLEGLTYWAKEIEHGN
jgi:GntR family transcriptional regulator, transcriptional repressor for pyruvate dehydrogenase complex